jgi:hypothetical protein
MTGNEISQKNEMGTANIAKVLGKAQHHAR